MQTQLFPPEIINNTTEAYLPNVSVKSQIIYFSILIAIIATLSLLPFITTEVSVNSQGVIRAISEKNELKASVSGVISEIKVTDNQIVKSGQVLFSVTSQNIDTKLRHNSVRQSEKSQFINDLQQLTQTNYNNLKLNSPLYRQQYNQFILLLQEKEYQIKKATADFNRFRILFDQKVIAPVEMEEKQFTLDKLKSESQTFKATQRSQWEADLLRYQTEVEELKAQEKQDQQEKMLYLIKAPVSGTIQQLTGKYIGSYVQVGEVLGIVSPDSNLIVECNVLPSDIGLLKKDMLVHFQIDAFNYNEWGLVNGKITDIGDDFVIINNQPVFKVKCKLEKQIVSLKNGYTGRLKKGMTLRVRFIVANRTLFQLLYDKADNWLNPSLNQSGS